MWNATLSRPWLSGIREVAERPQTCGWGLSLMVQGRRPGRLIELEEARTALPATRQALLLADTRSAAGMGAALLHSTSWRTSCAPHYGWCSQRLISWASISFACTLASTFTRPAVLSGRTG